jgi:tetratricopeptide (TPR) repeat protein
MKPETRNPKPATPNPAALALALFLVTLAVFWPAVSANFIWWDDPEYVTDNPRIWSGMTWDSVRWAFTTGHAANWHPLTWISHMLDCQLYGLTPWGHHLTNILLHAVNTSLLFLVLRQMTGATWRCLFVAAVFGLHPLRVESVAWVAERKDVLAAFFWILTMAAYAIWQKAAAADSRGGAGRYALVLVCFALGLMSKPMLVTLPCALLLLDYWPLERFRREPVGKLLVEKIPFLALAALASAATIWAQERALADAESYPVSARLQNALVAYCRYIGKTLWPADLAFFYPMPDQWPVVAVLLAVLFLAGFSLLTVINARRYPWLPVGWFWFLGTLVPVIGLVQVGLQSMADRYSYLPSIGLLLVVTWGAVELLKRWPNVARLVAGGAVAVVIACACMTNRQVRFWKDSERLARSITDPDPSCPDPYWITGDALLFAGRVDEAIARYREALRLLPEHSLRRHAPLLNLAIALAEKGKHSDSLDLCRKVLRLRPDRPEVYLNLGMALAGAQRVPEAIQAYRTALKLREDYVLVHQALGLAFLKIGRPAEACDEFTQAIRGNPYDAISRYQLAGLLMQEGRLGEAGAQLDRAIVRLRENVKYRPTHAPSLAHLAEALRFKGRRAEAIACWKRALELDPTQADGHNNLGILLAETGAVNEATDHFREALRQNPKHPDAAHNLAVAKAQAAAAGGKR